MKQSQLFAVWMLTAFIVFWFHPPKPFTVLLTVVVLGFFAVIRAIERWKD